MQGTQANIQPWAASKLPIECAGLDTITLRNESCRRQLWLQSRDLSREKSLSRATPTRAAPAASWQATSAPPLHANPPAPPAGASTLSRRCPRPAQRHPFVGL